MFIDDGKLLDQATTKNPDTGKMLRDNHPIVNDNELDMRIKERQQVNTTLESMSTDDQELKIR